MFRIRPLLIVLFFLTIVRPALADSPTYQTSASTTTFFATLQPFVSARLYYPSAQADGSPLNPTDQFPVVVFMQGANVVAERYEWLGAIAAAGYIVIIPDKPAIPNVPTLTTVDILDSAIQHIKALDEQAGSGIFGRYSQQTIIAGHSFGGFVSIVAAQTAGCQEHIQDILALCPPFYELDPTVKGMWLIGGHRQTSDPNPTSPTTKPDDFPIYLIAGEQDGLSTRADVIATFDRYVQPKFYYEMAGANHFQWTSYLEEGDRIEEDGVATISAETQQAQSVNITVQFMDCVLEINLAACAEFPTTSTLPTAITLTTTQSSPIPAIPIILGLFLLLLTISGVTQTRRFVWRDSFSTTHRI